MTAKASLLVDKANDILNIQLMNVEGSKLSLYIYARLDDQQLIAHAFSAPHVRDSANCAHAHIIHSHISHL